MGCLNTVDLRRGAGDADCGAGRRVNPATGACAACRVDDDPACPCSFARHAAGYPWCEGESAVTCDAVCTGGLSGCTGYDPKSGTASNCSLVYACCINNDTACCPAEQSLYCSPTDGSVSCLSNACCEADCADDAACDTSFQTCSAGKCKPGCDTDSDYCHLGSPTCECRESNPT